MGAKVQDELKRLVDAVQTAFADTGSDASNVTLACLQCLRFFYELRKKESLDETMNQIDKQERHETLVDAENQVTSLLSRSVDDNPQLEQRLRSKMNKQEANEALRRFEQQRAQREAIRRTHSRPDPDDITNY